MPDLFDPDSLDGRFYQAWLEYPTAPLPEGEDPRLFYFLAGAMVALEVSFGPEGRRLAEGLVAGLLLRDTIDRRRKIGSGPEGPEPPDAASAGRRSTRDDDPAEQDSGAGAGLEPPNG